MTNNELTHYGVKGMKWGVRRRLDRNRRSYKAAKLERKAYNEELYEYGARKRIEKIQGKYEKASSKASAKYQKAKEKGSPKASKYEAKAQNPFSYSHHVRLTKQMDKAYEDIVKSKIKRTALLAQRHKLINDLSEAEIDRGRQAFNTRVYVY